MIGSLVGEGGSLEFLVLIHSSICKMTVKKKIQKEKEMMMIMASYGASNCRQCCSNFDIQFILSVYDVGLRLAGSSKFIDGVREI